MKKIFAMILTLALLLCGFAMAEGKTVKPMVTEIDLAAPADGIYAAYFAPADLGDGQLKFTIYTEDCYDIVDIDTLAVGDTIIAGGIDIKIETLESSWQTIMKGIEETRQIQETAKRQRNEDQVRLERIKEEIRRLKEEQEK